MPSPTVSRPEARWSSVAIALARSAGGVNGAHSVAVPSPMRVVCEATCASGRTASWTAAYDGSSTGLVPGFSTGLPAASVGVAASGWSTRWKVHSEA
jgi:hypothetical protein